MTSTSTLRAALMLGVAMAVASPAFADGRWEHHGDYRGGHDRRGDWHGGGGGGGVGLGLLGLGVGVAVGAALAPPPVYYAPPPVYYAPPPAVYYGN
jgi:hypothetical protein